MSVSNVSVDPCTYSRCYGLGVRRVDAAVSAGPGLWSRRPVWLVLQHQQRRRLLGAVSAAGRAESAIGRSGSAVRLGSGSWYIADVTPHLPRRYHRREPIGKSHEPQKPRAAALQLQRRNTRQVRGAWSWKHYFHDEKLNSSD